MTYQDESALPFFDHVSKLDGPAKFLKWNSQGPALRQRKRRLQPLPATASHAGKGWSLCLRDLWLSRLLRRLAQKIQAGSLCYFEVAPAISVVKTQRAPNQDPFCGRAPRY